jgi:FecR protein
MRFLLMVAMLISPLAATAQDLGTVTIVEGQAQIFRGLGRLHAAEGVRLAAGDIVETAPATFAQIELADRSVIQVGPATRLMFQAATQRPKVEQGLYLLDGWLKRITGKRDNTTRPGLDLRAPSFELPDSAAVAVLHSTPSELRVFVESGELRLAERHERQKGASPPINLRTGNFYLRKLPAAGSVASGMPPGFVEALPRAFRDNLPLRIERFRERAVTPRDAPPFAYADVEHWLKAEPAVRRALMQRWRSKIAEPPFRAALVANLSSHPEWDPILFPEKYKPKIVVPPRPPVDAAARAASAPN